MNSLVDGLRQDTIDSYASIRHNVDQSLVAASKHPKKMLDGEVMELQQVVHSVLRSAAGSVQKSFADEPKVVDRSLRLIVRHTKRDESAKPGSSSAHSAKSEP